MDQLLQGNFLTCPQDRTKLEALNEVKTFPQNKYILSNIRRANHAAVKEDDKTISIPKYGSCTVHNRQLNLYCKETDCQKPICAKCLLDNHRIHEVVDIEKELEEKNESLKAVVT